MRMFGLIAFASLIATPAAAATEPTDDQIIQMTAIKWAGMNCGKLISSQDYQAALTFTAELDDKTAASAMRRVKFQMSKAATRDIACKSVVEAASN